MTADPARRALDDALLEWMREDSPVHDDARFEALALELFAFQVEHCAPYARFCAARGAQPGSVGRWQAVPAVPTGAFKEVPLRCFPQQRSVAVFRTSGTSTTRRGELSLDTLELYEASLLHSLRRFLLPDWRADARPTLEILCPDPRDAPDSSLSYMFGCARRGLAASDSAFHWRDGALCFDELLARLAAAEAAGKALCVCGTAFAFAHLLDQMQTRGLRVSLPEGSRVMETGGFKGRSREISRAGLYAELHEFLGVPSARIVNQYGMTELGSQFYDSNLAEPTAVRRKLGPPWVRVRLLDPASGEPVPDGEVGMLTIHDLANTGSVAAIQTADLGRRIGDGFEILGREPGAEARGCSIAFDTMLEPARHASD